MREALAPQSVEVVITSPPYNIGVRYTCFDDTLPRREYLRWTEAWVGEVKRALAGSGSFFLNLGSKPSDPWVALEVAQVVRPHFVLQNVIHWVKSIAIEGQTGKGKGEGVAVFGHYKPVNSKRFLNQAHEYLFHFTHSGKVPLDRLAIGVPYQDKSNLARWRAAAHDLHCRGNVWFIPYDTIQRREPDRPHPSSFPPRLAEMCLRLHGVGRGLEPSRLKVQGSNGKGQGARITAGASISNRQAATGKQQLTTPIVVLDPFMGIGSTALACARLVAEAAIGRSLCFVGFEIDPDYYREAIRRTRDCLRKEGISFVAK